MLGMGLNLWPRARSVGPARVPLLASFTGAYQALDGAAPDSGRPGATWQKIGETQGVRNGSGFGVADEGLPLCFYLLQHYADVAGTILLADIYNSGFAFRCDASGQNGFAVVFYQNALEVPAEYQLQLWKREEGLWAPVATSASSGLAPEDPDATLSFALSGTVITLALTTGIGTFEIEHSDPAFASQEYLGLIDTSISGRELTGVAAWDDLVEAA